mgnify:CR=1 FL=1
MLNKFSKLFIAIATCIFISNDANAQDPAFSQFYANPLYLNPAFAGATPKGCPRVNLNYRDQWPGIGRTYVTYSVAYDQHINSLGGGLGIIVAQDRSGAGNLNTTHASLLYSYHLEVTRKFSIKAGFEASYRMISLDWKNLTFGDMIDSKYGFIYPTNEDIVNDASRDKKSKHVFLSLQNDTNRIEYNRIEGKSDLFLDGVGGNGDGSFNENETEADYNLLGWYSTYFDEKLSLSLDYISDKSITEQSDDTPLDTIIVDGSILSPFLAGIPQTIAYNSYFVKQKRVKVNGID